MMRATLTVTAAVLLVSFSLSVCVGEEEGWTQLMDGKTFDGWKASENTDSWKVEDDKFVCFGPRSHLFYVGDLAPFANFEFKAEVMTTPGSNSGIYFHTKFQAEGWPKHGFESQVNNTHKDPKKTGGLYGICDVFEAPAKDDEWFEQHIIVKGKKVIVKIDGKTVVDYTEPADKEPGVDFTRALDKGTFALQAHDPKSKVYFKNIRVKKLP